MYVNDKPNFKKYIKKTSESLHNEAAENSKFE